MMKKISEEKIIYMAISVALLLSASYFVTNINYNKMSLKNGFLTMKLFNNVEPARAPSDYYQMFTCPCCGSPIDTNCCGMAKSRKEFIDEFLQHEDISHNDVLVSYAKKFGFDGFINESVINEVKEYLKTSASKNPPKLQLDIKSKDLGLISQKDGITSTEFTIKNTGKSDLIIENMDTSCMCTSAQLIMDNVEGPVFGMSMHGNNPKDYSLIIPAGKSALLRVIYDPNKHGPQENPAPQKITRYVTIVSNDPENFQSKVKIELMQVP